MTSYTTFFLCKPDELAVGFPTWKPPLSEPVLRQFKNPVTGGFFTMPTLAPEWPEQSEISWEEMISRSESATSEEAFSESRLPAIVRDHPRWTAPRMGTFNLTVLSDLLGAPSTFECALCAPPSVSDMLVEFPEPMFTALKALNLSDLSPVAEKWAAKLLPPEDFEPVEGEPAEEPWSVEFAQSILEPIMGLAKQAKDGQRMYLLMEN